MNMCMACKCHVADGKPTTLVAAMVRYDALARASIAASGQEEEGGRVSAWLAMRAGEHEIKAHLQCATVDANHALSEAFRCSGNDSADQIFCRLALVAVHVHACRGSGGCAERAWTGARRFAVGVTPVAWHGYRHPDWWR